MDQRQSFVSNSLTCSIGVLYLILLGLSFFWGKNHPTVVVWLNGILAGIGFLVIVIANIMGWRIKKLGVYEPTKLFGRQTEAITARKVLYQAGVWGLVMFVFGVIALFLSLCFLY